MHIYAFGSICRGEFDHGSDIDLLAIVERFIPELDPSKFSIYSYSRIMQLWDDGSPFAWHLATESKILYSSAGNDFLSSLETPNEYEMAKLDCSKFKRLFSRAKYAMEGHSCSPVFELSTMFLAVRNFATCFALGCMSKCEFSRFSARRLGENSLKVSDETFSILERSRLLSTRGHGAMICQDEVASVLLEANTITAWMDNLLKECD